MEQLPGFISAYRSNCLSNAGKRVLGCFIFQALDDYLGDGASESLVRETLQLLAADYHIHETEFRYWAHIDVDDQDQGESNDGFHITPYVNAFIL